MRVERIGLVGAGTMGSGIAQIAALGGFETRLHDPEPAALEAGIARMRDALEKGVQRERWSAAEAESANGRTSAAATLSELSGCDLVIEAAPEDLELKRELLVKLAGQCGPDAVLATNTSSLPVTAIAEGVPNPERVVGMHFFNPPALMKLVEVVAGAESGARALDATTDAGSRMGRTPIRAKDSPGFVANRLARPFTLESLRMLGEEVADAAAIDRITREGGGFRMGPFELIDLIGLDVNLTIARSFFAQGGEPERWRPSPIQERMVAADRLGRKSGEGFYPYPNPGSGTSAPHDSEKRNRAAGDGARAVAGAPTLERESLAAIDPAGPAVLPRLVAQIANEAAFALAEGVASAEDMDTAMRLGFNWPLGPIEFAELIGAERAVELLGELRAKLGEAYEPAPLLAAAAAGGCSLREASG